MTFPECDTDELWVSEAIIRVFKPMHHGSRLHRFGEIYGTTLTKNMTGNNLHLELGFLCP